jgi:hypothetical protein
MSTLNTLGVVAVLAVLLALPGIPAAIIVDRRRPLSIAPTLVLAQFLGLGIVLTIVLGLVHVDVFAIPAFAGAIAIVTAALWVGALRSSPTLHPPKATITGGAMAVIIGAATLLRTDPIYFIYQTADFGEYVNRANRIAAGGAFGEWFLDLFPATLAVPSLIFGSIHTVDAMPLLGLLLVAGIAEISHRMGFSPWVTVAVAFVAAFHILPVWYSEFPASEMLSAVLLVGMLLALVTAVTDHSTPAAVVAGSFGFFLTVARANAVLLVPIVLVAAIAALMLMDKQTAKTTTRFIGAFFVASTAGFMYDIHFSFPYFVDYQLGLFFPGQVIRAVTALRNPVTATLAVTFAGAATWGLVALARWIAAREGLARRLSMILPLAALAVLAAFIVLRAISGDYASPAGKILILGPLLAGLTIAGIIVGPLDMSRSHPERRVIYWIATLGVIAFAGLQSVRLGLPNNDVAPYYLYWQRYYISEVFPLALLLALRPIERLTSWAATASPSERWHRIAPIAVAAGVMLIVGVEALGPNLAVASGTMFDGSYEAIAELDDMTSDPEDAPIVYIGSNEYPEGWFWLNTSRLVALPLQETFGRDVVGNQGPREPDLQLTSEELAGFLDSFDVNRVFVITDLQTVPDGGVLASRGWDMRWVGDVDITIERLPWVRDRSPSEQQYVTTTLELQVYEMNR